MTPFKHICTFKINLVITKSIKSKLNDMAELHEKIMSVNLLVIVIIVCKRFPCSNCLMQGSCVICINF